MSSPSLVFVGRVKSNKLISITGKITVKGNANNGVSLPLDRAAVASKARQVRAKTATAIKQ